jgi:hypothetical protein
LNDTDERLMLESDFNLSKFDSEKFLNAFKFLCKGIKVRVGNHTIDYVEYAGCTLTIVQEQFVTPGECTGNKASVLLADSWGK